MTIWGRAQITYSWCDRGCRRDADEGRRWSGWPIEASETQPMKLTQRRWWRPGGRITASYCSTVFPWQKMQKCDLDSAVMQHRIVFVLWPLWPLVKKNSCPSIPLWVWRSVLSCNNHMSRKWVVWTTLVLVANSVPQNLQTALPATFFCSCCEAAAQKAVLTFTGFRNGSATTVPSIKKQAATPAISPVLTYCYYTYM